MHYYVQAWSVPEVLRPLYESSKVVAQKMTIAVRQTLLQSLFLFFKIFLNKLTDINYWDLINKQDQFHYLFLRSIKRDRN